MLFPFSGSGLLKTCIAALGLSIAVSVNAELPASDRFELTKPSYDLFRHVSLKAGTVQQSFAFDNKNRRLFVIQRKDGAATDSGHLSVTQLDFSGKYLGYMHLNGFGHGVAFGAEAVGDATYLWTEADASSSSGYGTKLTRFKYANGKTLSNSDKSLPKSNPISGGSGYTCTIDTVNNRLVVRYSKSGRRIAVFDLKAASDNDFSKPLADVAIPKLDTLTDVFQGYAAYGQYLYLLTGESYEANGGVVDSQLATIDMNTGKVVQKPTLTKAGKTLSFREAEGMAIYQTAAGEVRLFLGFASGKGGDRRSNLFYKNALVK